MKISHCQNVVRRSVCSLQLTVVHVRRFRTAGALLKGQNFFFAYIQDTLRTHWLQVAFIPMEAGELI